jgi:hypothetical protein
MKQPWRAFQGREMMLEDAVQYALSGEDATHRH